jgi:hypothetical protein
MDAIVGAVESVGQVTHCVEARYDRRHVSVAPDSIGNALLHQHQDTSELRQ